MLPNANEMIPIADLVELNKSLRKAGNVGYQTPAGMSGESLSALVPQSIEGTLASATFTMKEIVLWNAIAKRQVGQTVHEFNRIEEHGAQLDPFIAEGGAGSTNRAEYSREFVKIKYLAERREVSDVATMVGLVGPNSSAIAEETQRGTLSLMQKVEHQLFHGDSSINPLAFDGLIKQLKDGASGNVTDMQGASITPDFLQDVLCSLGGPA